MNSRERVRKAIRFEEPDRVPLDLGGTVMLTGICAGAYNQLKTYLGFPDLPTEVWNPFTMTAYVEEPIRRRLGIDVIPITNEGASFGVKHDKYSLWNLPSDGTEVRMPPDFVIERTEDGGYTGTGGWFPMYMPKGGHYFDMGGPEGVDLLEAVSGSPKKADLKEMRKQQEEKQLSDDEWSFMSEQARHFYEHSDYSLMAAGPGGGLPAGEIMSLLTNAVMLMREDPDYVHEWFDVVVEGAIRRLGPFLDAMEDFCDVIMVTCCDFGSQQCEFIPPELFKEFYVAPYKRVNDYIHKHSNMKTMFHSCGAISRLIPHFIDAGVDILNPMQTLAQGMEPEKLKAEFGGKVVIWGAGVETQTTLPLGTVDDVVKEVKDRVAIFKPGGGFVFNPTHNIQDLIEPEKIVAAYDTAREAGVYG